MIPLPTHEQLLAHQLEKYKTLLESAKTVEHRAFCRRELHNIKKKRDE